jgi:biotin transport system substrate-specific component
MQPTMTIPRLFIDRVIDRSAAMNVLLVVTGSFLIAVAAQFAVPIPFSPVPMTLQPLAVILVGAALGSSRGAAAAVIYLLEGFSGLPVFAGAVAGPAVLAGPTAGYLLAFPAAAWITGAFSERGLTSSIPGSVAAMALSIATIHLGGWAWLATVYQLGAAGAFFTGVVPFLAGDAIKIAIAAALLPSASAIVARFSR